MRHPKGLLRKPAIVLATLISCTVWWSNLSATEIIPVETLGNESRTVLGSTVIPYKEVTLSAQIPGVVKYVAGAVGTNLAQGGVIFQIDDSQLRAKRQNVVAQINIARAAWQNAQSQYYRELSSPRSKDVSAMPGFTMPAMFDSMMSRPFADSFMNDYDSDMVRQADLSNAYSGLSQAQGQYQAAMAQLQEIDSALRDANAIAPFAGIIMQKMVEVGDTVQPGQPLIKFGYIQHKRLQADVPSGLVSNLQPGMQLSARVANQTVPVTVAEIYPVADPQRHTVTVKFDLPSEINAVPGSYAEINVPEGKHASGASSLLIPRTALLKSNSLPGVLVVQGNSSELRLIRLGTDQGNGKVEVLSGLSPEDKIINQPPPGVQPGWHPDQVINPAE